MRIKSSLLAFSSCFVVGLSWRFRFFSEISRFWGKINLPKLTTFGRDSRPSRRPLRKSALVERVCTPVSAVSTDAYGLRSPPTGRTATRLKNVLAGSGANMVDWDT
jgi:hypothetical protein